jgi:amino acid permease
VLSLPYSLAMLGWVAGIFLLILFAWTTLYTAQLLADCHIVDGHRTRSYIEQVEMIMGRKHMIIIAWLQQSNLVLTALACELGESPLCCPGGL